MPHPREVSSRLYSRLRRIAGRYVSGGSSAALRPTEVVHEAWVKLAGIRATRDSEHYLALVARVMRQVLLDHRRDDRRLKRGGGRRRVALRDQPASCGGSETQELDELLEQFKALDPRAARVLELKVLEGMPVKAIAAMLRVSPRTIDNDWSIARAWMRCHLGSVEDSV